MPNITSYYYYYNLIQVINTVGNTVGSASIDSFGVPVKSTILGILEFL